jgi:hypothetical protein
MQRNCLKYPKGQGMMDGEALTINRNFTALFFASINNRVKPMGSNTDSGSKIRVY